MPELVKESLSLNWVVAVSEGLLVSCLSKVVSSNTLSRESSRNALL